MKKQEPNGEMKKQNAKKIVKQKVHTSGAT